MENGMYPFLLIVFGGGLLGLILILYYYLEDGKISLDFSKGMYPFLKFTKGDFTSEEKGAVLKETSIIAAINKEINKSIRERETDIATHVNNTIDNVIQSELFTEKIKDEISITDAETIKFQNIFYDFYKFKSRLDNQIGRLTRNSNLNLAIGSATTLFAVYILWQLIFSHPDISFANLYDTLSFFLPRITLAIFIEIFAFFFLRIYKKNLEDLNYFQNEQTNVDSKLLALKSAFWTKDQETLRQVILELIKTERNFVIKKDETTIGLRTIEIENEQEKKIYDFVTSLINNKK